jgi:hypothetical protein
MTEFAFQSSRRGNGTLIPAQTEMKRQGISNDYAGRSGKCRSGVSSRRIDNTRGFGRQMDEEIEVGGDVEMRRFKFPSDSKNYCFLSASRGDE